LKTSKQEWLTRAEFAKRVNVSASMVSRYVSLGLHSRADKRIECGAGLAWVAANVVPEHSGSWQARQRSKNPATGPVSATAADLPADATAGQLIERLFGAGMACLCELSSALGLNPAQRVAAVHIAASWLWAVAGEQLIVETCGPNGPAMNYSGLTDISLTAKQQIESERLADTGDRAAKRAKGKS
jgi:hypothetical protein